MRVLPDAGWWYLIVHMAQPLEGAHRPSRSISLLSEHFRRKRVLLEVVSS